MPLWVFNAKDAKNAKKEMYLAISRVALLVFRHQVSTWITAKSKCFLGVLSVLCDLCVEKEKANVIIRR